MNVFENVIVLLCTTGAHYIYMGALGGFAYCLIAKLGWQQDNYEIFRRLALGMIAGFLCYLGNLPNYLTSFGMGYLAVDAIEAIANRVGGNE